jgi:hypothetical protein
LPSKRAIRYGQWRDQRTLSDCTIPNWRDALDQDAIERALAGIEAASSAARACFSAPAIEVGAGEDRNSRFCV